MLHLGIGDEILLRHVWQAHTGRATRLRVIPWISRGGRDGHRMGSSIMDVVVIIIILLHMRGSHCLSRIVVRRRILLGVARMGRLVPTCCKFHGWSVGCSSCPVMMRVLKRCFFARMTWKGRWLCDVYARVRLLRLLSTVSNNSAKCYNNQLSVDAKRGFSISHSDFLWWAKRREEARWFWWFCRRRRWTTVAMEDWRCVGKPQCATSELIARWEQCWTTSINIL